MSYAVSGDGYARPRSAGSAAYFNLGRHRTVPQLAFSMRAIGFLGALREGDGGGSVGNGLRIR